MTPIYDKNAQLSGWFDGKYVFDPNLNWIAFFTNGHFFSAKTCDWLGPMYDGSLLDKNGKPVAWLDGSNPNGSFKPHAPLRPIKPLPPIKPLFPPNPLRPQGIQFPLGGWSSLSWSQWIEDESQ